MVTPRRRTLAGPRTETKPRVLVVDDHPGVLKAVSTTLADDYVVAGTATDGWQAVDMASRVEPDVIVLDVSMAGLNGFQTKRALDQAGSQVPVVFLSMVDAEEFVSEAFRCGGRGYVLKSRAPSDLVTAIDHVLQGRVFVPSLTSLAGMANVCRHAMYLSANPAASLDSVAALFDLAFRRGDATCVIATEDLREGLSGRLRARGWDLSATRVAQRYLVMDAAEVLSGVMRDGLPDRQLVADTAAVLDKYRVETTDGATSHLVMFANAALLLHADGNTHAAVALERIWNLVTRGLPLLTVCGYSSSCLAGLASASWASVCAEHAAVSHASDL